MARLKFDYDILVLGGGSAGLHAAKRLAAEGKRVALCEPGELGGYEPAAGYGDRAPLIEAARLFSTIRSSAEMGIRGGSVGYNYPTLREWNAAHNSRSASKRIKASLDKAGVQVFASAARLIGAHEVTVGRQHVSGGQILICTGSSPIIPATIAGLENIPYLTPQSATDLLKPPKSVFIIGGGKTGVEFAGLFSSFGSVVSIAEIGPRLLPAEDSVAGDAIKAELEARGSNVLTSARITGVSKEGLVFRVTYLRGDVEHVAKVERVLLAAGRAPGLDIGLENADVDYSPLGITVSDTLQTSVKHIYAAGSVTGNVYSAEGAIKEADYAVHNLLHRDKLAASYNAVPSIVYSQPAVARVGINEPEALRKDITIMTATSHFDDTVYGSANRNNGTITLTMNRKGLLVGATIVARHAAEPINTLAIAIEAGMTVDRLSQSAFAYGSTGDAIRTAAQSLIEKAA